jgi:hypothetical protein
LGRGGKFVDGYCQPPLCLSLTLTDDSSLELDFKLPLGTSNKPSVQPPATSQRALQYTHYFDIRILCVANRDRLFEHCLRACGAYNRSDRGDKYVAVTFIADLTSLSSEGFGGNCYLKSGRGERTLFSSSNRNTRVSALVVEDNCGSYWKKRCGWGREWQSLIIELAFMCFMLLYRNMFE